MPQRKIHASAAQRQAEYRRRCKEATLQQLRSKGLPALPAVSAIPGTARWRQAIESAAEMLYMVVQEMEAYFEDRSEQWQESEKGEVFRERIDALCEARDTVQELTVD